jgi:phenylalanyl-tRNA synthetase beta chain
MKVSLKWLSELVELPSTTDELVSLLTMAGVEVEGIETHGCAIPNVVVAEIKESVQHPQADRLSVCKVDDGSGNVRQIVCGAKNYKVGDKVPLALPGATLPGDFTIKVGKLRGVESQGMLCSAEELGLPKGEDGLLILPQNTKVGLPISELFQGDTVLDLEITPNRPDLLSYVGIAREVATLTSKSAKGALESSNEPAEYLSGEKGVTVQDESLCPLYTARHIRGVNVGPSPDWLRSKLESVGLRSINNVVDVTNFVMLELGQPLHAFDSAKLRGALQVRVAREGERFQALDGKTYALAPAHLVIADAEAAVAIAGIMGGEDTGVKEGTTDIVLESAFFQPQNVRRTSRQLGLSSDSSYRFERGVDMEGVVKASNRAVDLILQVAGGQVASELLLSAGAKAYSKITVGSRPRTESEQSRQVDQSTGPASPDIAEIDIPSVLIPHDETPLPHESSRIPLRRERVAKLLGVEVSEERIEKILTGFGLTKHADRWVAPSFRRDLTREVDLIEEIARVIGMDAIPVRELARFTAATATDRAYDKAMALRRGFVAQGLHEARSVTLVPTEPNGLAYTQFDPKQLVRVKNPMIDDQVVLRPNLLHGLLTAVTTNLRAGVSSVRLFEIGRVFSQRRPEEFSHAAIVLTGPTSTRSWRNGEGRAVDLYDLKGLLSTVLGAGITFKSDTNPALALSLIVENNGKPVGFAGQLWPADARALDAREPVVFAEIDLTALDKTAGAEATRKYREIPRFPAVTRDVAMLAPLNLEHARITAAFTDAKEPLLASVELFDVFTDPTGAKIPADKRSLAYSLTYRSPERTLTADEVNAAHAKLKERVKSLGVTLRE